MMLSRCTHRFDITKVGPEMRAQLSARLAREADFADLRWREIAESAKAKKANASSVEPAAGAGFDLNAIDWESDDIKPMATGMQAHWRADSAGKKQLHFVHKSVLTASIKQS